MKRILALLLVLVAFSCQTKQHYVPATDGLNAGIEFISACVKGDFDKANFYMLQDEDNKKLLEKAKEEYTAYGKEQKKQLMEASLQNITLESISPTEAVFHYYNSYTNAGSKVKVVQKGNVWLADFKYKFNPNL